MVRSDLFISYASEDRDSLVDPLAHGLMAEGVDVWYDVLALRAGDSLRQSIDLGMTKARAGLVVLSKKFFEKDWPQWELNGLVQRHLSSTRTRLIPIWHEIDREYVLSKSPPLADIFAVESSNGIAHVVRSVLRAIKPQGSALKIAQRILTEKGFSPPPISDDWWLDLIEFAHDQFETRWYFPFDRILAEDTSRGERLAWIALQDAWQNAAHDSRITQISHPDKILDFVRRQPGLAELCDRAPEILLVHAPQLSIPGFGGKYESDFNRLMKDSIARCKLALEQGQLSGTGLTITGLPPACSEEFSLRHPSFADLRPIFIAGHFVSGPLHSTPVQAYEHFEYIIWLLSSTSSWLPEAHRAKLVEGMRDWAVWPWIGRSPRYYYESSSFSGELYRWLCNVSDKQLNGPINIPKVAMEDLFERTRFGCSLLNLADSPEAIRVRFIEERFIERWLQKQIEPGQDDDNEEHA